jgi:anti-sigma-K factor RskA
MNADLHVLTGAYAGGALPADEREEFEEHLKSCAQCEQEVRELVETSALLGVAAAAPPPPDLRARVLAEVAVTRQLPPLLSQQRDAIVGARPSGRPRRWSLTVAACLAVVTIGLGSYAVQLQRDNTRLRGVSEQIAALQTAPDARSVTNSKAGVTATVTVSRKANQVMFLSRGLTDLRKDRTYQLWLIGKDGPHSAGTFAPSAGRHGAKLIAGPGDAEKLAVTEEPAGGSAQPTTKPILVMDLPQA